MKLLLAFASFIYALNILRTDVVFGQTLSTDINETVLSNDSSYCFEFTWMGSHYDNLTKYDGTCTDLLDESRAGNDIPCNPPLVITFDGTPPDVDWLWTYYRNSVLCRRTNDEVCAKYSFKYDGHLYNSTYMCTKARSMTEGSTVTSGCFTENKDGFEIETCICKSDRGYRYKPCNSAYAILVQKWVLIAALMTSLSIRFT